MPSDPSKDPQMPSGQGEKRGIRFWLVELKENPSPKRGKKSATGQLGTRRNDTQILDPFKKNQKELYWASQHAAPPFMMLEQHTNCAFSRLVYFQASRICDTTIFFDMGPCQSLLTPTAAPQFLNRQSGRFTASSSGGEGPEGKNDHPALLSCFSMASSSSALGSKYLTRAGFRRHVQYWGICCC